MRESVLSQRARLRSSSAMHVARTPLRFGVKCIWSFALDIQRSYDVVIGEDRHNDLGLCGSKSGQVIWIFAHAADIHGKLRRDCTRRQPFGCREC